MKVCKKCNKSYPDEAVFCTECGEKLVEECKCPRCGANVEPADKFCSQCGYNLKQGNKCSKCGVELKPGAKFCPSCGEQLEKNQVIETKTKPKAGTTNRNGLHQVINYVLLGMFFLIAVLSIIGFFGDIALQKAFGLSESVTIRYFFGEGAKDLEKIALSYTTNEFYNFSLISLILHSIVYFGGIVGLFTTIGIGIYKAVVSFKTKNTFSRKFFLFLLMSTLPYLSFTSFMFLTGSNVSLKSTFGWGTTILVISSLLSALCYSVSYIFDGEIQLKPIAVKSLTCFSFILVIFISLFGVSKQISLNQGVIKANLGIYAYFGETLQEYSSFIEGSGKVVVIPDLVVLSFLFGAATVIIDLVTITGFTKAKKSKLSTGIVCVGTILIASLLSGIFASTEIAKTYVDTPEIRVGLGSGVVFTMVFSILALAALITALALNKEDKIQ